MQVTPLAHRLTLVVALLPPMQSMFSRAVLFGRANALSRIEAAQLPFEGVEHFRDMIVELRPRDRGGCSYLRVMIHGLTPGVQDGVALLCQI